MKLSFSLQHFQGITGISKQKIVLKFREAFECLVKNVIKLVLFCLLKVILPNSVLPCEKLKRNSRAASSGAALTMLLYRISFFSNIRAYAQHP